MSSDIQASACLTEMLRGHLRRWLVFCGREETRERADTHNTTRAGPRSTCFYQRFVDCVWPPGVFLDLLALPRPLALAILSLVPVDTRLRCCEVNRAWRALLLDTSLWSQLDFSDESGCAVFSKAVFCAALLKGRGRGRWRGREVRVLDARWRNIYTKDVQFDELVAALEATASTSHLLELVCHCISSNDKLLQLTGVISKLRVLKADGITTSVEEARHMLTNHPPYGPLRLRGIKIRNRDILTHADVGVLATDLAKHTSLETLTLERFTVDNAEAMAVIVDAAISLRLRSLCLDKCQFPGSTLPEFMRLMKAGWLKWLCLGSPFVSAVWRQRAHAFVLRSGAHVGRDDRLF